MAISTADPASLDSDPPFLLRHPRARGGRGFMAFLTGIRSEPPRMMLPRLEPVLGDAPEETGQARVALEDVEPGRLPVPAAPAETAIEIVPVEFEPAPVEPVPFEPIQISGIELPPLESVPAEEAAVELLQPEQALFEALPVEELVQASAIEAVPSVAPLTAPVIVPRRRSWGRRIVGGLLSAAAYTVASLMLLAAAPVYLLMSDRQDVVHWSNELLDLVARW